MIFIEISASRCRRSELAPEASPDRWANSDGSSRPERTESKALGMRRGEAALVGSREVGRAQSPGRPERQNLFFPSARSATRFAPRILPDFFVTRTGEKIQAEKLPEFFPRAPDLHPDLLPDLLPEFCQNFARSFSVFVPNIKSKNML